MCFTYKNHNCIQTYQIFPCIDHDVHYNMYYRRPLGNNFLYVSFFMNQYFIKSIRISIPMKFTFFTIIFHFDCSSFFFSDSLNAFTSSEVLVLHEPHFNFSSIFLNILCFGHTRYIPAEFLEFVPNFPYIHTYSINY